MLPHSESKRTGWTVLTKPLDLSVHEIADTYGLRMRRVDFVGEDIFIDGLSDGPVETNQELPERFVTTPNQHCQAAILIGSGGDTADRMKHAESDVTISDQGLDVGQG